jgi:VWFA-related protein
MRLRRLVLAVAFAGGALLASTPLIARSPAQSPSTPPGSGEAGQPTFRVAVDLVMLDVIPRDESGRFVSDLQPSDFEVLEDGVRQEIVSAVLVHGGRVFRLQTAPPSRPVAEGIVLPETRPVTEAAGRIFVILVDDLHLDVHDTTLVRDLMKKISTTLIHDGDTFAIVSTGPSAIEEPLTYDRRRLQAAIGRVKGSGLDPSEIFASPRDSALGPADVRRRVHVAFSTAYQLMQDLEKVRDRRKALILLSNGYDLDPFPQARLGKDQVFGGRYGMPTVDDERGERLLALQTERDRFADVDLAAELHALGNAANRANVSIYAIDPRGIAPFIGADLQLGQDERKIHLQKTQASLRTLAEATGGLAIVNDNDFTSALKRIDAETSDYYVLGYYLSDRDPAKRTRRLEVRVKRANVTAWSRSSYTLRPRPREGPDAPR